MITFKTLSSGITVLTLCNKHATAEVSLYGGQVLSFKPKNKNDILFVSEKSLFTPGKAIRGGIPVCWPWFGPHATEKDFPVHGFVRTTNWRLAGSEENGKCTTVTLECVSSPETKKFWPHDFTLSVTVSVGKTLDLAITTKNDTSETINITDAFHTYYRVSEIADVSVKGFDGSLYIDRVGERTQRTQDGDIVISGETDRVYLGGKKCVVSDSAAKRTVTVEKDGFPDTIVWNPWIERAKAMADFDDEEYRKMICVEAGSALDNKIELSPGASVTQKMTIIPRG